MEENKAEGMLARKPVVARALRGVPAVVAVFEIHEGDFSARFAWSK